ncbi:MAG: hypothetical protein HY762_00390 [Planctomycetes bacterium]|nr:hypothetical protein [Planctomycetota bacterium]
MKKIIILVLAALGILYCGISMGEAKRAAPKEVEPVVNKGVKYTAPQDKIGYVQAWNVEDEEMLWEKKVYDVKIDPKLEEDVQQIHITSLSVKDDKLIVVNEAKEKYEIDLKNKDAPVKSIKEESLVDMLHKVAETYYDIEEQSASRFSCFIKIPDIAKVQEFRTKFIMEKVDYEYIWEKRKPFTVKARELPGYFGPEAKWEAVVYAGLMEKGLQELVKVAYPVKNLLSEKSDDKSEEQTEKSLDSIVICINKEYQLTKFEVSDNQDRMIATILPIKHRDKKLWNISKLDITKQDKKGEFIERTIITYMYEYTKGIMLPKLITLNVVDKGGKLVARRNEPNPINVQFTKYEVEVNK